MNHQTLKLCLFTLLLFTIDTSQGGIGGADNVWSKECFHTLVQNGHTISLGEAFGNETCVSKYRARIENHHTMLLKSYSGPPPPGAVVAREKHQHPEHCVVSYLDKYYIER